MDRIPAEIMKGVMHPAHVPLKSNTQSPGIGGAAHAGPGGGFLSDHKRTKRVVGIDHLIELLKKLDGFQVLVSSMNVGNPFPFFAAVIQIKHGSHRVWAAQAVDAVRIP